MMRSFCFTLMIIGSTTSSWSQKHVPFKGMLEYKISVRDTILTGLFPDNKMIVYTNDTVVRIENYTSSLGKQVTIRHLDLNKSYLLLDTEIGKYAIQMDLNDTDSMASDTIKPSYTFEKKCGKRKILGRKVKRVFASNVNFKEPIEFYYLKNYRSNLVNAFPDLKGLPVRYSLPTADAIFDYELVKMSEYAPNRDLFGISEDYERVSFDDFIDKWIESKSQVEPAPEGN